MSEKNIPNDKDVVFGCNAINPKHCKTCAFSHGEPPFADLPEKAYCMVYARENGISKPNDVYFDGAECEFYEKA